MMDETLARGRAIVHECFYYFARYAFGRLFPHERLSDQPYLEAFCFELEACARGRTRRLVVNMPPRQLKSFCLICLQAWMLGRNPQKRIVVVSYGDELGRSHTEMFRAIVLAPWFQDIFPRLRAAERADRLDEFRTQERGYRRSASIGGAITGFGGDVIICDDLIKAQDAYSPTHRSTVDRFINETLLTRFNNPADGVLIAALQRLHETDATATLLQLQNVRHLSLPAIADRDAEYDLYEGRKWARRNGDYLDPLRLGPSVLSEIRSRRPAVFASQYQQAPETDSTRMLDINRMRFVAHAPSRDDMLACVQCWDTAQEVATNADWSVGLCWGWADGVWTLVDMVRGRWTFPVLKEMVEAFAEKWQANRIFIEYASSGRQLCQQFDYDGRTDVEGWEVEDSKEVRFYTATGTLLSDGVAVLDGQPWTNDFRREVGGFPFADHDDIADSAAMFAHFAGGPRGEYLLETARNGWRSPRPRRGPRVSRPRP
jgi:predicted phage terminase large subunit-like protein